VQHRSFHFLVVGLALFALCACNGLDEDSSTDSGTSSVASSSAKTRMSPSAVLALFNAKNGTNTVNFRFLSNGDDTTSTISTKSPTLKASYIAQGYQFDFTSNWDTSKASFGYLNLPAGKVSGKDAGVYRYTLDSKKAVDLGDKEGTGLDVYEQYYTPNYLYANAEALGKKFEATSRSEYNALNPSTSTTGATSDDVIAVAKALSVYGILTEASSSISFHHVELNYTASSTSYVFTFYVDYDGKYAASGDGIFPVGARATLNAINSTKVSAITTYLGA
jgi:hypothetical protein